MPNPYQAFLYPKATLGSIMQEEASKNKQGISTYLMKVLLEHFKEEFIKKWGKEEYDNYHNDLSLTIIEQTSLKQQKEREKKAKEQEKIERQIKALELKKEELAIRNRNLNSRVDEKTIKAKIIELRETMRNISDQFNPEWQKAQKELLDLCEKYPYLNK